jgi:hypothetical protein
VVLLEVALLVNYWLLYNLAGTITITRFRRSLPMSSPHLHTHFNSQVRIPNGYEAIAFILYHVRIIDADNDIPHGNEPNTNVQQKTSL